MSSPLELDVYGLRVAVRGPWDEVLAGVRRDFAWFVAPGGEPHLEIQVEQGAPDYAPFGDAVASFVTGRNVVYQVGTTTLVDYAEPRRLRHLVIGHRTLAARGRLEPLARHRATRSLLGAAVAGVGVYQGMEFVLQSGWSDVVRKSGTAGRRAIVTGAALRRAGVWRLWLGRDRESNWEALLPLLHGEDGPRAVGRASRA